MMNQKIDRENSMKIYQDLKLRILNEPYMDTIHAIDLLRIWTNKNPKYFASDYIEE